MLDRRSLLIGGSAIAVTSLFGAMAVELLAGSRVLYARRVLERLAGPFSMDDVAFGSLVEGTLKRLPSGIASRVLAATEALQSTSIFSRLMPSDDKESLQLFERALLTDLVMRTDYLDVADRRSTPLQLKEGIACLSPFARF